MPPVQPISLTEALDVVRTGDIWVFRGQSVPDRAIRLVTNAPVNHVGMAVVLSDLPSLMWHAELGQSLVDVWTGDHHRGVQLHDLGEAVTRWTTVYRQQAWLRQLHPEVDRDGEDNLLRTIARYDGTSFPSTAQLAWRWARGRRGPMSWLPVLPDRDELRDLPGRVSRALPRTDTVRRAWQALVRRPSEHVPRPAARLEGHRVQISTRREAAYCAEVVALTYEAMGLLEKGKPAHWYDPGRFWSGKELPLVPGWVLGAEIPVRVT